MKIGWFGGPNHAFQLEHVIGGASEGTDVPIQTHETGNIKIQQS